ncbi:ATP-binding protein [Pontibacterium sp. N1Y112]|uniref:ATP-binding protein n=1 Tax=Pontibacterium sinense TaxID=2781979 RepID=A0A8J7K938_9GAMM|nr:ATP-binding protein [Pontibacterium sinense]MBE9399656.1 ATP-binding protein [Pontibacterium sinense]
MSERHFPFSAVAGQAQFKLALILAAINPSIGGVVISGPRGCAKSTLARGLADLLPSDTDSSRHAFVTLPLGASEEMLLGTLDLQKVLDDQTVAFRPGLLSKAHGGVLYVDEVNLLADHLVDQLLDVAASGINRIERDGISHSHPAQFLLIGTMNPDEGELRPQLHDRFGLCVELSNQYSALERVEIVRSREAFDRDPQAFCVEFAEQQGQLLDAIHQARLNLPVIQCDDALRLTIAERCNHAQVDGLRADIVWYRAALAHAAWCRRTDVTLEDLDAVEHLVLAHRRKTSAPNPPQQPDQSPPPSSGGFKRPDDRHRQSDQDRQESRADSDQSDWGSMAPQQQRTASDLPVLTLNFDGQIHPVTTAATALAGQKKGIDAGDRHRGKATNQKPNWFSTLVANSGIWPPEKLRFQRQKQGLSVLHLVLLDTSASTLGQGPESVGKAALLQISEQAYLQREQLSVFGFGNNAVENLLPRVRAPKELRNWLDNLPVGGGTPMRDALEQAMQYLKTLQRQTPALQLRTYILTDGRSSAQLNDLTLPGETVWIDIEQVAVKRGRGPQLAAQLGATYLPLPAYS